MCGIAGFFSPHSTFSSESAIALVQNMADSLAHRGPDSAGVWVDAEAGIALGHRRLAVLDRSSTGHQPMMSESGRFVLTFNGEIYNHLCLRKEAEATAAISWRGRSDTETLLAGFERWGVETTLQKTVGMFAIALWDRRDRVLTLARDRIGEKPLYYGWQVGDFLFGSELKSLSAHPALREEVDRNVLALYLRYGYVPAPYSIYQGIYKLLPGTYLQLSGRQTPGTTPNVSAYWSLREVAEAGLANPFRGSDKEAISELENRLAEAVSLQRIADVPLGVFLSGGIDSSTIVALMQAQCSDPVKTFSIGFHEESYNEAEHAKAVALHLKTDHTELYVSPGDALQVIPRLPSSYDEPLGDSSAIPTFLVSQLARQHVTVSLSGDGGDELFGGYDHYRRAFRIWTATRYVPPLGRRFLGAAIPRMGNVETLNHLLGPLFAGHDRQAAGEKVMTLAMLLSAANEERFYITKVSQWKEPERIVRNGTEPLTYSSEPSQRLRNAGLYDRMMYVDAMSYLPDDILVKVDRAAMAVSLETRVPMLDHRVVELAWQIPLRMKRRGRTGKWLLRQVLYKYVPQLLVERPKRGFAVPIDRWLRGPLREWAEDLLSEQRLNNEGYLNQKPIRARWLEHVSGRYNWQFHLWNVLMFQAWVQSRSARSVV